MLSTTSYEKFRAELYILLTSGDGPLQEDNLLIEFISKSKNASDVIILVEGLKDEGNSLFKQRKFEDALEKYGYAGLILAHYIFKEEKDRVSFWDLAVRILLNADACCAKVNDHNQVGLLCSVVLEFEPKNVKALYRRASTSIVVGKIEWAYWDLVTASEIDPKNKEISKELDRVKLLLSNVHSSVYENDIAPAGLGLSLPSSSSLKEIRCKAKEKGLQG